MMAHGTLIHCARIGSQERVAKEEAAQPSSSGNQRMSRTGPQWGDHDGPCHVNAMAVHFRHAKDRTIVMLLECSIYFLESSRRAVSNPISFIHFRFPGYIHLCLILYESEPPRFLTVA